MDLYARFAPEMEVDIKSHPGIAIITLNRPEKFNAMNERLHQHAAEVWPVIESDDRVRCVVVTGRGKAFSAGGDMEMIDRMVNDATYIPQVFKEARALVHNMVNMDKPVISAVNGVAVGAGCVVALMCDIIIASSKAKFGDGHIKLGVAAGDHAACVWPLLASMAKCKYYLLTGDMIPAKEAERIGLVTEVVEDDAKLMQRALEVANKIANGPQLAIRYTKRALNQWERQSILTSFDYSCALEMLNFSEPDAKEGLKALKQKREPNFPSARL